VPTVLLDLDGTLTDPREGIVGCIRHALVGLGHTPPPDGILARYIGPPLADTFRELLGDPGEESVARAIELYRERFGPTGLFENRVYPGIPELLSGLTERGLRAAIATSKPAVYAERIAVHFGLRERLHAVYGSELDGRRVHKRDLLAHALDAAGVSAAETVMVGDRHLDVAGAAANGIDTIGVTWGYGTRAELREAGARWVCDAPDEVVAIIDDRFARI
jgi:phosphoglycolate phosphatase